MHVIMFMPNKQAHLWTMSIKAARAPEKSSYNPGMAWLKSRESPKSSNPPVTGLVNALSGGS